MPTLEQLAKAEEISSEESKIVWTTEKVEKTIKAIEEGYTVKDNPFFESDSNYRKGNIVFEYSDYEYEELKKCARDVVYFANKYCKVMTDDGYIQIKLRPYQEEVLKTYQSSRHTIFLSCRQSGKCSLYNTNITLRNKVTGEIFDIEVGKLYDLVNTEKTFIQKFKSYLYKLVGKIEKL
jgi:hypothetical protein